MKRLPGYLTKTEVADLYGVDEKTVDRRRKTEPLLQGWVKAGKRVLCPKEVAERYLEYALKRGKI
ncbi:MAG: hypothetical protein CMJ35_15255 [Phycisphaerae bacterium]|nr:hypothetical protein [Phycisphaerae bacterium]MBM92947.1 hypothetical protein [Phycisphaerae bacterium]HCT46292.1 hypothetical protein [Phycisphaerales bacterium]|tara:strand:- start:201 stop:395 length:195 start_codon:yes stop_codon:yes gene_type:complete